jgi:hypothetical protein
MPVPGSKETSIPTAPEGLIGIDIVVFPKASDHTSKSKCVDSFV